jgi:hypothetical protein
MWVHDIPPAIRDFKIFAHGQSLDLKRFGFITLWRKTPSTLFASSTANETSGESFKVNECASSKLSAMGQRAPACMALIDPVRKLVV